MIGRGVPDALRADIRAALLGMDEDADGRAVLAAGLVARFASVADTDYDAIRRMAREAHSVLLT